MHTKVEQVKAEVNQMQADFHAIRLSLSIMKARHTMLEEVSSKKSQQQPNLMKQPSHGLMSFYSEASSQIDIIT